MSERHQKTDSLQPPIEIVGVRVATGAWGEIVGSRIGRRHQLAGDVGKMSHHFSRRVRDVYAQISRSSLIAYFTPTRTAVAGHEALA